MGCSASMNATNPRRPTVTSVSKNAQQHSLQTNQVNSDKLGIENSASSISHQNSKESSSRSTSERARKIGDGHSQVSSIIKAQNSEKSQEEKLDAKDRLDVDVIEEDNSDGDYSTMLNNCEFYHEDILHEFLGIEEIEMTGID
ncbi:unnamed protein product [Blepharisma stoltei]|uniref:Uncharacterized protein n=1 Tax=Blepharisma stoltei TaxID=1481888 RepID=A0AAU9J5Z4_9CILI|nr:unnamed protein product [Blepharisma stoltei]